MSTIHDLSLSIVVADISAEPSKYQLKATEAELKELASRFELNSITKIEATVNVRSRAQEQGILLEGHVKAELVQRCITTLSDVPEQIDTPFALLLVDAETADRMDNDENYMNPDEPEYDALEGDTVYVGEIISQTVAISLNPYPRAADAELTAGNQKGISVNEPELQRKNPFAVLGKLKDES